LLMLLLLAACGGGVDAPDQLPPNYTIHTGDRVALALPHGWTVIPPNREDFARTADHLRETNPALATQIDAMAAEIQDDTLRFYANHQAAAATVNITAERVPPFARLASHAAANRAGLENFGYEIVTSGETMLNG